MNAIKFRALIFLLISAQIGRAVHSNFSDSNWISMNPSIPGADGTISTAVVDDAGNLYIGGGLTLVGDQFTDLYGVAKWDGRTWTPLGSGTGHFVYALAVSGTNVYAGGEGVVKWDGRSWSYMGTTTGAYVYALAVSGNTLYAGGEGGFIAKWDGSRWSALVLG